jgi:predicted enzyme related to lactoylglutathione lyase
MHRAVVSTCFASLLLTQAQAPSVVHAQAPQPAPIVFFDIAGPESADLAGFYSKLFGWKTGADGNLSVPVVPPLGGTLRSGDATEKRLYIGVADVAATLAEVVANGGTIDAPRFEVPGVVVLGLFKDPAGNPMALVEMENGKAKVP